MSSVATPYECPTNCFGVTKVEGENAFEFQNIVTGKRREWRFCHDLKVPLYAGYILTELVVVEHGPCQWLNRSDLYYKIARGKDSEWKNLYGHLTYNDGPDRPVLARNCHNTPDDRSTFCEGGEAKFTQEISYAKPAR